jgi:hypothetical protein
MKMAVVLIECIQAIHGAGKLPNTDSTGGEAKTCKHQSEIRRKWTAQVAEYDANEGARKTCESQISRLAFRKIRNRYVSSISFQG